jgi:hypothetical protein
MELLLEDMRAIANRYPGNGFLYGLYEIAAGLRYWSQGRRGHWMLFYMINPAWRQPGEDD